MDPKTQQAIAVVALIVALIVGGGIVYWFLFGSKPSARTMTVDPKQQTMVNANMRLARPPRPTNGVESTGENAWQVRSPSGTVSVTKGAGGIYNFVYSFAVKLPNDQQQILLARWRMLNDAAMAKEWNATPEQVAQLKAIKPTGGAQPSQADREAVRVLWNGYMEAGAGDAKTAAAKKLTDKLEEVAKSSMEPAKAAYADRVEQVKRILTPEQLAKISGK
jgi:Spy/CpxP family protein refolding chaperone